MINAFDSLQKWYVSQCNEDWEHEFGIKIDTLDNPGWIVHIDLKNTDYEKKVFHEIDRQLDENNWVQCEVKNNAFKGAGGPENLTEIIQIFTQWIGSK